MVLEPRVYRYGLSSTGERSVGAGLRRPKGAQDGRAVRHRWDPHRLRWVGARSWRAAFEKLHGVTVDIGDFSAAGQTDPEVALATFRGALHRDPEQDELSNLYAHYLLSLADDIGSSAGYRVLAGVERTLLRLGEAGAMLGLVSGALGVRHGPS